MATDPTFPCIDAETAPAWKDWPLGSSHVKKIVLGKLGGGQDKKPPKWDTLPSDLAQRFPALTHLHVWGLGGLERVPELPPVLECLDVRGCPLLSALTNLPATVRELVVEDAPLLKQLPGIPVCEDLDDLSLRGCASLPEATIHGLLKFAPNLRRLDLSGCAGLSMVAAWPRGLLRIELNKCAALRVLPADWPEALRRLGLRGAKALLSLPRFDRWPDYLDLAGTEALRDLGRPKGLRTLFLYGSGVLVPPASEHGATAQENVAPRTIEYFDERELCGDGKVKRCKVLVLGNGNAGKTCLSLALVPGKDPKDAAKLGSTHGVQFWPWTLKPKEAEQHDEVELHLWDFGGQEIYHQTHGLFMSRGAVFVVAWKPSQDGCQAEVTAEGYQDEWRPLEYWLDYIELACPWHPRIAVVCTHQAAEDPSSEERIRRALADRDPRIEVFFVDSWNRAGQLSALDEWITETVLDVVQTQGTAVPAHWEIAQDMVASWWPSPDTATGPDGPTPRYADLTFEEFGKLLKAEIDERLARGGHAQFPRLRAAIRDRTFELTDVRVARVLEFLTNSGWVYWERKLFEGKVIVGQKWALDGIYAVLDRRLKSGISRIPRIHPKLLATQGEFTRARLDEWVWRDCQFSEAQQELLLTFMEQAGVCFRLVPKEQSLWRTAVYKTFEHLPTAVELGLDRRFDAELDPAEAELDSSKLHRGHWNLILKSLGETYGTDGEYARDGFLVTNREGQSIRLLARINIEKGLGGTIHAQVTGLRKRERLGSIATFIATFLPRDPLEDPGAQTQTSQAVGEAANKRRFFISYAWNPRSDEEAQSCKGCVDLPVPPDYEEPVNLIEEALKPDKGVLQVDRDKSQLALGDDIVGFMRRIKTSDKVLVVHSDKYWRSWYCLFEITQLWDRFEDQTRMVSDTVLFLELDSSGIGNDDKVTAYRQHWDKLDKFPTRLRPATSPEALKIAAANFFVNKLPRIHNQGKNKRWSSQTPTQFVAWVRKELNLDPDTPKP